MSDWNWTNAKDLCIEGRGFSDTKELFHRLPARAEGMVRDVIWDLSQKTTGIYLQFETNSTELRAKWTLGDPALCANHTPIYAFSGLDLYGKTKESNWHWVGLTNDIAGVDAECAMNIWGPLDGETHEFRVYLPLYNSVKSLEIGVPQNAQIRAVLPRPEKPIVYYGTSIVHGAGASRAGMTQVAILGRRLDYPILNLGFSGNAIMEPEVAELLAELDPAAYILDSLPNMTAEIITERAESFIALLRAKHPDTPIVLVEDRTYPAAWITPTVAAKNATNREAFKHVYAKLLQQPGSPLYYIEGDGLLGIDNDGTSDGSHANDLGASRMADALEPVLKRILGKSGY